MNGGDGHDDAQATLTFEAGGPIELAPDRWSDVTAAAIGITLRMARDAIPQSQLVIRATPDVAAAAAGLAPLSSRDYRRLQQIGGHYAITGAQPYEGLAWADRAHTIAERCLPAPGGAAQWHRGLITSLSR